MDVLALNFPLRNREKKHFEWGFTQSGNAPDPQKPLTLEHPWPDGLLVDARVS